MNLVLVLAAGVVSFALLHFWGVPTARTRAERAAGPGAIAAAGVFALADVLRTITFLVAIAALLCVILLGAAELAGKGNLGQVERAVGVVRQWRALLEEVSPALSIAIALVCGCGLLILGRRTARAKVAGMLAAADRAEAEQIFEQMRAGTAKEEPDTPAMADIRGKLVEIDAQANALQQAVAAEADQGRKAVLERQLAERLAVRQNGIILLLRLDIDRRRAPPKPVPSVIPAPTNRWERLQDVLFSRGTLSTMSGAARLAFVGAMLLMVPSLLGVASVPAGFDLANAEIHLSDIEMSLEAQVAQQEWQHAAEAAAPAANNTANISDEEALDQLSQLYDQGLALHFVNIGGLADHHGSNVQLSETREHILHSAATQRAIDGRTESSPLESAHSPSDRVYLEMAQAQPPLSPEAAKFREDLKREVMERQPDVWRKIKGRVEGLKRSFTVPLDRGMMRGMMVARVASAGLGAGDVLPPDLANLGSGIEASVAEDTYRIRSRKFLASIMSAPDGNSAIRAIDEGWVPPRVELERDAAVARRLPDFDALEQRLAADPPRFPVAPEPHAAEARHVADALMATAPRSAEQFGDSLATFEDFFPGRVGAEAATARGILLEAHNIKPSVPSEVLARMAGNFKLLRGFSRIGGVLIGQDAANPDQTLDFIDMSWKALPSGIGLTFTRADGTKIEFEPRPTSLIAQALTYAADGRPVTATMTRATPLRDLKILAHPTLVDTGVGCRAIEIDRFVDTFLSSDPDGKDVLKGVNAALDDVTLYDYAMRAFSFGYLQNFQKTDRVKRLSDAILQDLDYRASRVNLEDIDPKAAFDPGHSPLTVKKEFFEAHVVDGMRACLADAKGAVDELGKCMIRKGQAFTGDAQGLFDEATEFIPWSGVRERDWSLDPDLAFAKNGPPGDQLYPFDFVEQLAALGPANFASANDAFVDPQPFVFPAYQQQVTKIVIKGVSGDQASRDLLEDMRQFTLLQRLFRAVLAGELGKRFPLGKLGLLADATNSAVQSVHTPRWTPHPGALEQEYLLRMESLASALNSTKKYDDLVNQERSCLAAMGQKTRPEIADIPDSEWGVCDLREAAKNHPELNDNPPDDEAVRAAALVRLSATLREARQLRVVLGVAAEEQAMRTRASVAAGPVCPRL